jgi:hypothetical protein
LIRVSLQFLLIDINAQAGVDGEVLVASDDLFGLNLYPLPGPSSCRVASLLTWAMTITSVPSANRSHSELQGLPPTQRCRENRSRVGLRSHHGSRGNSRPRPFGRAKLDTVCQE